MAGKNIAVVGATGAVGLEMLKILEERNFAVGQLSLVASKRSEGKSLEFSGREFKVHDLNKFSFRNVDIVLSSPGASVSRQYVPRAVSEGAVVIDNTSAFRLIPDVPLVVPEVNPGKIKEHKGIIANPNCSTIQLVAAIKPIHDSAGIKRIIVSTYQAVSGAGAKAVAELKNQTKAFLKGELFEPSAFPHRIAFNLIPQIDSFLDNGYTKEEMKMVDETKKIMGDDSIKVSATAVRAPVFRGHSESVNLELKNPLSPARAKEILSASPGLKVIDSPADLLYPMPVFSEGRDEVFIGRLRADHTVENGLNMWIVSDNLRKGAALNAIQIAEKLAEAE
jgi:aspartate-semialdehyde dehydrogenase